MWRKTDEVLTTYSPPRGGAAAHRVYDADGAVLSGKEIELDIHFAPTVQNGQGQGAALDVTSSSYPCHSLPATAPADSETVTLEAQLQRSTSEVMACVRRLRSANLPLGFEFEDQVRSILSRELHVLHRRIRLLEVRPIMLEERRKVNCGKRITPKTGRRLQQPFFFLSFFSRATTPFEPASLFIFLSFLFK